jgi:hypothetical protein
LLFAGLVAFAFSGCEQPGTSQKLTSLEERLAALEKDFKSHETTNEILFKAFSEGEKQNTDRLNALTTQMLAACRS